VLEIDATFEALPMIGGDRKNGVIPTTSRLECISYASDRGVNRLDFTGVKLAPALHRSDREVSVVLSG
jgi:hypothetical protein